MNQIKFLTNSYATSGTLFKDTTLEAVLKYCLTLPKDGKKGAYGSVFIYNSTALGEHLENELSTGIILIDIDNIHKEVAEKIYQSFNILVNYWNCLIAVQYSSSYYIKDKAGIHVYIKSEYLDKYEYNRQAQICLAVFARLVNNLLGINLLNEGINKDDVVLDFHNTNLYQRFNLFYSEFKYNEYAETFSIDNLKVDDLIKLIDTYKLNIDINSKRIFIHPISDCVAIGGYKDKIKIDRNFKIGKYTGNAVRFRISMIADRYFGDKAKDFCNKYFYCENNKSIYNKYEAGNTVNPLIYKWLMENGYIVEATKKNEIKEWISEYSYKIMNDVIKYKHLEIIANTGSGKTTFVNNELAQRFKSVVIVPFNVTNRLYDNCFEINSLYNGRVPKSKPIVMVWDQACKYWYEIKDRHVIIDEAHTLFLDRNYRDKAIELIMKLKENNCWVTLITATPTGESKIFDDIQIVEYYKRRNVISLNVNKVDNIEWSQYNYIKQAIDNQWYDKVVLLDDTTAKKIYEKFIVEGYGTEVCYIRSSTKESEDFIDLRQNELLKKKITICTCVAFNGLNFKNKNEKILVVGSIKIGETTASTMIQQIGRIRNSEVHALYFYNDKDYMVDIDDKVKRNEEKFNMHIPEFMKADDKWLNPKYVEAMREIQSYELEHSNIDSIVMELSQTGYINGVVADKCDKNNPVNISMTLALKKKESNEMKSDILNGLFLGKEYDSEYKSKWSKDINRLISNENYSGIDLNLFISLFQKGTKHKLIETTINNLKEIIRVLNINDDLFDKIMNEKDKYVNMLSDNLDRKQFIGNLKHMKQIKEDYKDKIKIVDNKIYFDTAVYDIIALEEENQLKFKMGNSKGGKKSKKIKDMETGKIYDSCKSCALDIGKGTSYINYHKDRFEYISD